ncbi:hypothetical protein [Pedobacter xixiisoli]|uniref:Uncharacterized protein n=1 Tax=Pedobacter xixiisoli TaxID=1476464 RepID=A0A285ZX37_9SPHI|nr:hypothetical protein [Pedobacter xixiisoli]SOD14223.1 hypothetical protein SAMN06297358_1466 [Pedobacter xixiisoli]
MKANINSLIRATVTLCLLIMMGFNVDAQVGPKLIRKKKVDPMEGKVKPIMTSPVAGSTIDGPFVMVGKAEPNTFINLYVTPIYREPTSSSGKPVLVVSTPKHKPQHFSIKADEKGVWQSPVIEVLFDSKTSNRRIFAFVSQTWGTDRYDSKQIEYFASPKLTMIMAPMKVPAKHNEEEKSSGQPEKDEGIVKGGSDNLPFKIAAPSNNKYVARDRFTIAGIAPDGANVKVEVRYFGYRSKSNITIQNFGPVFFPGVDKNTTTVNDAHWATYTIRSKRMAGFGESGLWATDEIEFIRKIDGYSCWANSYTITASLIDANGKSVRPIKVNVTRMNTVAVK